MATEGNQCKTDAKTQAKKKKKNQLLHFYPITSLQDLTAAKITYTKCKSHTVCLEKQHFPQIHFLGNKKREQEEQIHMVLKENKSHTSVHSTSDKEVFCLHTVYLRLKTNIYSVQAFTVSCCTQNPVLATQESPWHTCRCLWTELTWRHGQSHWGFEKGEGCVDTETALHPVCTS